MTGRAAVLAVAAFVATALPAFGQTTLAPDLQPLVDALQSGKANGETVKATDAYVAAHPGDGNGYALQCALLTSAAQAEGIDPKLAVPICRKGLELAPDSAFANFGDGGRDVQHGPTSGVDSILLESNRARHDG